jgi:hypothetical protein
MLIIVLGALCLLTAIGSAAWFDEDRVEGFVGGLVCSLVVSFLIFIPALIIAEVITDEKFERAYSVDLLQVSDGSAINGRIGLFSGFINEEQYYFYYYDNGEGIVNGRVPADRTIVKEDSEVGGYLDVFKDVSGNDWVPTEQEEPKYVLHVPKGTVIRSWELDGPN